MVKGGISAVIATLIPLGWDPVALDAWVDARGAQRTTTKHEVDGQAYYDDLAAMVGSKMWAKASEQRNGAGLQGRAFVKPLANYVGSLRRKGRAKEAATLVAAATS